MGDSLYIVTLAILSIVLNIYLLYKVLTLQDDLESKKVNISHLKADLAQANNRHIGLMQENSGMKMVNDTLARELRIAKDANKKLKLVIYENISSYYKRGNKDE